MTDARHNGRQYGQSSGRGVEPIVLAAMQAVLDERLGAVPGGDPGGWVSYRRLALMVAQERLAAGQGYGQAAPHPGERRLMDQMRNAVARLKRAGHVIDKNASGKGVAFLRLRRADEAAPERLSGGQRSVLLRHEKALLAVAGDLLRATATAAFLPGNGIGSPGRMRACMTCGGEFLSEGAHNRMCGRCRQWAGGASPLELGHGGRFVGRGL